LTVAEIIAWADRYFDNQVSEANKIKDLDMLHKKIYMTIGRLKQDYTSYSTTSTDGQIAYTLPTDCRIDNIIGVMVSQSDLVNYDEYEFAGIKDKIDNGKYYAVGNGNTILISNYGEALNSTGLFIKILYYKIPATITLSTDTPELDSMYHTLLCYLLVQTLAVQGQNPNTDIADYYQNKYEEELKIVADDLTDRFNSTPTNYNQSKEWW